MVEEEEEYPMISQHYIRYPGEGNQVMQLRLLLYEGCPFSERIFQRLLQFIQPLLAKPVPTNPAKPYLLQDRGRSYRIQFHPLVHRPYLFEWDDSLTAMNLHPYQLEIEAVPRGITSIFDYLPLPS